MTMQGRARKKDLLLQMQSPLLSGCLRNQTAKPPVLNGTIAYVAKKSLIQYPERISIGFTSCGLSSQSGPSLMELSIESFTGILSGNHRNARVLFCFVHFHCPLYTVRNFRSTGDGCRTSVKEEPQNCPGYLIHGHISHAPYYPSMNTVWEEKTPDCEYPRRSQRY